MYRSRNIDSYKTIGFGDSKKIAIVMTSHGIGDDIAAMPGIKAKREEGYEITVFCKPFTRKVWQSLGCKTYPSIEGIEDDPLVYRLAFIGENFQGEREVIDLKKEFGVIYDLNQWSVWEMDKIDAMYRNRIKLFAELIETTVPEFSWIDTLKPQRRVDNDYVLYAPDSASKNRGIRNQKRLYKGLKKLFPVKVLGQTRLYHYKVKPLLARHGKKDYLRIAFGNTVSFIANLFIKLNARPIDKDKILCKSFDEFLSYIYSAKLVISADNGIMNTARAFGIPCIGLHGITPAIAADQYKDFNNAPYEVIKCDYEGDVDISGREHYILERSKQWEFIQA